jgi:hypothetical protein
LNANIDETLVATTQPLFVVSLHGKPFPSYSKTKPI